MIWQFLKTEGEKNGMPYSHYFRRGVVGTGIMVVSRFPIIQAEYLFLFPSHAFRPPEEEVSEVQAAISSSTALNDTDISRTP
jgi:hypothetical protein